MNWWCARAFKNTIIFDVYLVRSFGKKVGQRVLHPSRLDQVSTPGWGGVSLAARSIERARAQRLVHVVKSAGNRREWGECGGTKLPPNHP